MKTILQIAKEIGVSKQAVRKRITREPIYTRIQQYLSTVDGTMYIDVGGETLIKSAYQKNEQQSVPTDLPTNKETIGENVYSDVYSVLKETVDTLRSELEFKNKQLEVKDRQIEELNATIRIQAESINADRKNELAETIIDGTKLIESNTPEKKVKFFSRIFSRVKK